MMGAGAKRAGPLAVTFWPSAETVRTVSVVAERFFGE